MIWLLLLLLASSFTSVSLAAQASTRLVFFLPGERTKLPALSLPVASLTYNSLHFLGSSSFILVCSEVG